MADEANDEAYTVYQLKSGETHSYIRSGERYEASGDRGEGVPLTPSQYESFKDKFSGPGGSAAQPAAAPADAPSLDPVKADEPEQETPETPPEGAEPEVVPPVEPEPETPAGT